jgi:hypothetical protein
MDPVYLAQPIFTPRPISPLKFEPLSTRLEDILLPGSSDEDSPQTRKRKKRRREEIGAQYLRQQAGYAITFRLKGPLGNGWKNPWAEHGLVLSEKELMEMDKKRRARERAEEREREEERRGLRPSSPIDLTSDAEDESGIREFEGTRGRDHGGGKAGRRWLTSNVHQVRQEQSEGKRGSSPTPAERYIPQIGLQRLGKERYNGRETTPFSSPDSEDDEAGDNDDEEEEDELPPARRSPSIELEYSSSQERIRDGSELEAVSDPVSDLVSDLDLLDMGLPETRPRVERRVLKERMEDVLKQLNSAQYKGDKKKLHYERDVLKARISALTTEIAVLKDAKKRKAAKASESKKRGREEATTGITTNVTDHDIGRKKQRVFEENGAQKMAVKTRIWPPPVLSAEPSEASTQNSQQSLEGQGLSKSAKRRRNRRERQQVQTSPPIPRGAYEAARIKSRKDEKQVTGPSSRLESPLTSPKDRNALSGQASKGAQPRFNTDQEQAVEVKRQPDLPLTSARDKNAASTKKRKLESLPITEQKHASKEDVYIPTAKPSKTETTSGVKATLRKDGTKGKGKRVLPKSTSPNANVVEVSYGVRNGAENVTNSSGKKSPFTMSSDHSSPASPSRSILKSPSGWKPYRWLPGGQAYAEEVLKAHLASLYAGGPSFELPRRPSFASSQGSSSAEHEAKRHKKNGNLQPELKPQQEDLKVTKPSRVPGPMKVARELDENSRRNSDDSVNTAWQKDHARLWGKSPSKGSKASTPAMEPMPSISNELAAAVSKSVEEIIDDALGLLPEATEGSGKQQLSGVGALFGNHQAGDNKRRVSATSQTTDVSEVIDLVSEGEHDSGGAALAVPPKRKQPKFPKRARSNLSADLTFTSGSENGSLMGPPFIAPAEQHHRFPQFRSFVPKALAEDVAMHTHQSVRQHNTRASTKPRVNGLIGSPHVVPPSTSHPEFQYSRVNSGSKTDPPATKRVTEKDEHMTPEIAKAPSKRRLSFTPGGTLKNGVEVRVPAVSHEDLHASPCSQDDVQILHAVSSPKPSTTTTTTSSKAISASIESSKNIGEVEALPEAQAPVPPAQLPSGPSTNLLETDKQSLKFISTEDGSMDHFDTQAELAKAHQSFQRDLQSPIRYPKLPTSEQVPQPLSPGSDPAEEVTSAITPRPALRSDRDPYAGGPHPDSDDQEPLSTQAMVDAMSPFAISTVKKQGTFLHALARPAAAIFGYIGWGGNSQEPASQPAGEDPPAEDPLPVEEPSIEEAIEALPAPEPALEPAIDFGKSGLDMETSDDDAEEFGYELSQPSEFGRKRRSGKLENIIPSEDMEESDFESTLKKQRGVRDDRGRWARVTPQLEQTTPSRMTLRSFSSPQDKEEASGEVEQDGQRLTGLETVIDEAGSFLGTWDVEGEVRRMKASGSGSGTRTASGVTRKGDGVSRSGRRRSG